MPYKISGNTSENSRIIILEQDTWTTEATVSGVVGAFEVDGLEAGLKVVIARDDLGKITGDGYIDAVSYFAGGDRGVFSEASTGMDYITISTTGNATYFGGFDRPLIGSTSNGFNGRGILGGGSIGNPGVNIIDYITILSIGDTTDFGDLTVGRSQLAGTSNNLNNRAIFGGGTTNNSIEVNQNVIDYITISTTGNAADFGDLLSVNRLLSATSNGTNDRGIFGGGLLAGASIYYVTITSLGNATYFGDLTLGRFYLSATSNLINDRGVFGGGTGGMNLIDYITISSLSNAIDFGDLTLLLYGEGATSNGANDRGVFGGGGTGTNTISYITISSIGDAIDFGDLTSTKAITNGLSNG